MPVPGPSAKKATRRKAFLARIFCLVFGATFLSIGLQAECQAAASCPSAPFHARQAEPGPLHLDPQMGAVRFHFPGLFFPQLQGSETTSFLENGFSGGAAQVQKPASPGSFSTAMPGISFWQQKQNPPQPPPAPQAKQQHSPSATTGSPGHIFWVVPAFKVEYGQKFQPLTTKEKFQEWARGAYDPLGLGTGVVEAATLEHSSSDGFCGYGHGWAGYGKCFGSLELDAGVSSFIGDFALTALLHQDPRYFRLGRGSFGRRVWYAVARVFVTYNDSGRTVFYSSALSGTAIAAGLSNLYYPQQDRGLGHTLTRVAIDLGNTALYNGAAEFWPDFNSGLHRVLRKFKL